MSEITVENLDAGYGSVQILHQVSMTARSGEVTCIFGPNGCGKSTLLKAIVGMIDPWAGTVKIDDEDITHLPSHKTLGRGVAMMPQGGGVFPHLSVRENLRIGGYTLRDKKELDQRIDTLLDEFPRLRERYTVAAGQLSGGEQMILSIARALVLNPRFLLFDEPSAGLSPKLVGDVLVRAAELAQRGVGVLMIEQNIREAMRVADRMYVLVGGRNRFDGTPADVADDRELMHLYLGGR
ncbi:ABC transporter ATP-binding protein [Mycolicibacterium smegmatis]|uniref:ABC-type transport system ATP-binding protein I n=3 Tax=Mycolicibacterium smegmatis TaxID=1772 RepID=A0QRS1_MYCS2|nr:ABC transporter ATP-binding protein [Mycolicibacterium smegmatis]ABK75444.1 ABC-type transport system ATP-binding protein I [Mycolicibacterium smegmatis MC2 155]AFP37658.1 Branched-chain amino acid ABC transporter ATP-binding protein [Mycolicibacterium smegmatis MC2 155]AIU06464.1 ABC transporter ATP-binding protein [Mycolicibacterium smegmatis MC2 155]AIU13089.1 ABC transporter ATP-binding protein [Mycolicibacterium smegmatis]AIU19713.1 ABC transporter ATP-binding protein [Mycolicibacteriu